MFVIMFQAWPPKREHNKFECKECRPPRDIDISKEIHDLLSHKPKSSAIGYAIVGMPSSSESALKLIFERSIELK